MQRKLLLTAACDRGCDVTHAHTDKGSSLSHSFTQWQQIPADDRICLFRPDSHNIPIASAHPISN